MVTTAIAEISAESERLTCPKERPEVIKINENSETCAPVTDAKKAVLFLNFRVSIIANIIRGLPINIKRERISIWEIRTLPAPRESEVPKSIKNMTIKKSRKGLTLAEICNLYGEEAIASPERKAPMAMEKPKIAPIDANKKEAAIAEIKSSSVEDEVNLNKYFKMYLETT